MSVCRPAHQQEVIGASLNEILDILVPFKIQNMDILEKWQLQGIIAHHFRQHTDGRTKPLLVICIRFTVFPLQSIEMKPLLPSQLIFTLKCLPKCECPTQLSSHLHYQDAVASRHLPVQLFFLVYVSLGRRAIHSSSASANFRLFSKVFQHNTLTSVSIL